MIITDLYQTKIECSKYNVDIDDDTVTVTVTLKDFNNNNVTGKNVTLNCSQGFFTKCVGATQQTIDNVVTTSVTGTTNNNGQITATWTASDWGLCTFSANNTKVQCNVTGTKLITRTVANGGLSSTRFSSDSGVHFRYDLSTKICVVTIAIKMAANQTIGSLLHITNIPSEILPKHSAYTHWTYSNNTYGRCSIESDDLSSIKFRIGTGTQQPQITCQLIYYIDA